MPELGPAVEREARSRLGFTEADAFLARLENAGIDAKCKTQPPHAPGGRFTKADFYIDLPAGEVTCPAGEVAAIRFDKHGGGSAHFAPHCATCPLAPECTKSAAGRTIALDAVISFASQRIGWPSRDRGKHISAWPL